MIPAVGYSGTVWWVYEINEAQELLKSGYILTRDGSLYSLVKGRKKVRVGTTLVNWLSTRSALEGQFDA